MLPKRYREEREFTPSVYRDPFSFFQDMLSSVWESPEMSMGFRVDVEEKDDLYQIKADLPGVQRDQLDLSLENNNLTITVKQQEEKERKDRNFLRRERRFGTASRTIHLPLSTENKSADARFEDGVLTIDVPKSQEAKAKRIQVH